MHDGPLLEYLGVAPSKPKFDPTFFSHDVRVSIAATRMMYLLLCCVPSALV